MKDTDKSTQVLWHDRKHHLWWPISFHRYEMKNGRVFYTKGLFSTTVDEVLIYRITDIRLKRTLMQKIFGTGTIVLSLRGDSESELALINIKNPNNVRDMLSNAVESSRHSHNVVGREFYADGLYVEEP